MDVKRSDLPAKPRRGVPVWAQVLVWAILLVILIFTGIGLVRSRNPILSIGSKVPDFTLTLFEGYGYQGRSQVSLAELRGKVVLVNLWASWCLTCADEAAFLENAWHYYQSNSQVVFLGVDYTDVDAKALNFLTRYEITYPNGPDLGTRITPIFNRNVAMPETYIVDQKGFLRYQQIGPFQSEVEIRAMIDSLLAGN
jgi:cytochrome c biogenesis protein CcmG, thiol:disulfide interchange protein DsbE